MRDGESVRSQWVSADERRYERMIECDRGSDRTIEDRKRECEIWREIRNV